MRKYLTKDIYLILAASFFYMASPMLVTPLIAGYSETLGAGGALMGFIGGATNLCSLFCRPFVGNLADRTSKYRLSITGSVLMILSCAGYIAAGSTALILFSRIVCGIGFACCSVCLSTWMSQLLPREMVGSGMGLYGAMNALSMAVAPAIGVSVRNAFGYHHSFVIALVFAVLVLICIFLVSDKGMPVTEKEEAGPVPEKKEHARSSGFALLELRALPFCLVIMCFAIPYCATQSFIVRYVEARALPVNVSLFFPIYAAFLLVLRMALKSLFDKVPFLYFLIAGSVSALLSMICLWNLQSMLILTAASFFMAGGYGLMCSVCQSCALLAVPENRRGLANSTYYIGLDSGMAFGPMLGGVVYGSLPIRMFYPFFMIFVPLCIAAYLISSRCVKK